MGIVKFCSSGSEKLLPVIWYTHIRGVKLHLQYHQNQRVLGLVAAAVLESTPCSIQKPEELFVVLELGGGIYCHVMWRLYTCTDVTTAEGVPDGNLRSLHLYCEDSGRFMVILEFFGDVMLIERDLWMEMFRCLDSAG